MLELIIMWIAGFLSGASFMIWIGQMAERERKREQAALYAQQWMKE